jgi:hypothetical protein
VSGGRASGAGTGAMSFPFPLNQQRNEAERLAAALRRSETPILHVLRFSALTLNHMVLLFGVEEMPEEVRFVAYDPNEAAAPCGRMPSAGDASPIQNEIVENDFI